ncbi:hypothetical protein PR002_g12010 [Phytophthora rubi]|uniref:DUF6818 domain-containing protein n=1 Tax=Phytophthora rubi TaxID=129364 RepID=A0A6A3M268_9STRA|nr:hypothetical protein PR002_g12010 [Phytophthora rubi]
MTRRPATGRGRGFTTPQVDRRLAFVEQFLPLGAAQWDEVQYAFNRNFPAEWPQRDAESLRRKFFALKNTRKPTGDATCPPEVRRAKAIYRDIEGKCSVVELEDEVAAVEAEAPRMSHQHLRALLSWIAPVQQVACPMLAGPTVDRGADSATTSMAAGGTTCTHTKGPLKATPRTGKMPEQLAVLSN